LQKDLEKKLAEAIGREAVLLDELKKKDDRRGMSEEGRRSAEDTMRDLSNKLHLESQ
jgi:hypothetical protein